MLFKYSAPEKPKRPTRPMIQKHAKKADEAQQKREDTATALSSDAEKILIKYSMPEKPTRPMIQKHAGKADETSKAQQKRGDTTTVFLFIHPDEIVTIQLFK